MMKIRKKKSVVRSTPFTEGPTSTADELKEVQSVCITLPKTSAPPNQGVVTMSESISKNKIK